jgi:hypothetical protein
LVLIVDEETVAKHFEIIPIKNTQTQIENYLGPPSILAGKEFTMMVAVPTDGFDNPVIKTLPF